eukprot:10220448-Alexandrium_andersonii.AAC.1
MPCWVPPPCRKRALEDESDGDSSISDVALPSARHVAIVPLVQLSEDTSVRGTPRTCSSKRRRRLPDITPTCSQPATWQWPCCLVLAWVVAVRSHCLGNGHAALSPTRRSDRFSLSTLRRLARCTVDACALRHPGVVIALPRAEWRFHGHRVGRVAKYYPRCRLSGARVLGLSELGQRSSSPLHPFRQTEI